MHKHSSYISQHLPETAHDDSYWKSSQLVLDGEPDLQDRAYCEHGEEDGVARNVGVVAIDCVGNGTRRRDLIAESWVFCHVLKCA